ncbi:MAG: flagellar biosynthesis protein FlhF [Azoarcus sp.]|jgi:flagellar biosynthesis protein FlhF|nr:flagellar biosynthesis protein FlhF [Azoarcus sp.]
MDVKRYFAPTAREALRALKAELGAEAIVLSNRAVAGGVEILALPAGAIDTLHAAPPARPSRPHPARDETRQSAGAAGDYGDRDFHVTLSNLAAETIPRHLAAHAPRRELPAASGPRSENIRPFSPPRVDDASRAARQGGAVDFADAPAHANAPVFGKPARNEAMGSERTMEKMAERVAEKVAARGADDERIRALQQTNARLMEEITGIRGVIERELSGFSWNETRRNAPVRAEVLGRLLATGFSAAVARELSKAVGADASPGDALKMLAAALGQRLKVRANDDEIIDAGGVFALVGPTGVGKTTTVAKLAARFVTRHDAGQLALITTDGYRIGAQEQLRIYGRILGVPVFAVRDAAELRQTLFDLRGKRMVLVDTMGMSQRDRAVAAQAAMLTGAGEVRRLLLLNATCRGDTLDDVVKAFSGPETVGCILTKEDEAASLAPAIDVAVRRKLDICYITNGQRVPEDLHLPRRVWLLHRALRPQMDESPWRLGGDDAGAMLAAQGA